MNYLKNNFVLLLVQIHNDKIGRHYIKQQIKKSETTTLANLLDVISILPFINLLTIFISHKMSDPEMGVVRFRLNFEKNPNPVHLWSDRRFGIENIYFSFNATR